MEEAIGEGARRELAGSPAHQNRSDRHPRELRCAGDQPVAGESMGPSADRLGGRSSSRAPDAAFFRRNVSALVRAPRTTGTRRCACEESGAVLQLPGELSGDGHRKGYGPGAGKERCRGGGAGAALLRDAEFRHRGYAGDSVGSPGQRRFAVSMDCAGV